MPIAGSENGNELRFTAFLLHCYSFYYVLTAEVLIQLIMIINMALPEKKSEYFH